MTLKFKKLKPNRAFQNVVDQIQEAILTGGLKPGDMLPSEMKLTEMFDTSRGTVREALRVLEQMGLIAVKTGAGGGAVVTAVKTDKITESLNLFVQSQNVSFDQLAEFREGVEGLVAALAAERASADDIEWLERILAEAEELVRHGTDWKDFAEIDIRFHLALAEIVGNPIFVAVLHMVHDNILASFEQPTLKGEKLLQENYRDLRQIVAAIESRAVDEARTLAQLHVRKFNRHMKGIRRSPDKESRSA